MSAVVKTFSKNNIVSSQLNDNPFWTALTLVAPSPIIATSAILDALIGGNSKPAPQTVKRAEDLAKQYNLETKNTLPQQRKDRNSVKWSLRAIQGRRSPFQ